MKFGFTKRNVRKFNKDKLLYGFTAVEGKRSVILAWGEDKQSCLQSLAKKAKLYSDALDAVKASRYADVVVQDQGTVDLDEEL